MLFKLDNPTSSSTSASTTTQSSGTSISFSPSTSSTTTSNYLTPTEITNHRRTAVTPLPTSTPSAVNNPSNSNSNTAVSDNQNQRNGPGTTDHGMSFMEALRQGAQNMPKVVWNIHPNIKVKLRKRFYPLGVTRLTVGADYDFTTRETSLKWSWKDRVIGARLHVTGDEVALTKTFDVDVQTRLDLRAALDLHSKRTLLSLRVRPFGRVVADTTTSEPGLKIRHDVALDNRLAVQFAARLHLPEARFTAGTQSPVSLGDGNFVVDLDEMNFRVLLQ